MIPIYKREMRSFFISPVGYVFAAVYFIMSGWVFANSTVKLQTTDTSAYFDTMILSFVIVIPLLTMRLLSEERKTKTEQILMTCPVSLAGIITAKFLAAFTMFAGTLAASCALNLAVLNHMAKEQEYVIAKLNVPTVIGSIIGMLLVGAVFVSIGLFISSLTENQIVAAVLSMGAFILMIASLAFANSIENAFLRTIVKWFSIGDRYKTFLNGIFDFPAVIYFLSLVIIFIFLTVRVYEKRRWE